MKMLSREQLEDAKICPQHGCVTCKMNPLETDFCQTKLAEEALELLDKTEAQEKEIEKLKKQLTYEEGTMESEAFDARQLRYDINQLKAQNAAYREALELNHKWWKETSIYKGYSEQRFNDDFKNQIELLNSSEPIEYHNPADVEVLKMAKEALLHLAPKEWTPTSYDIDSGGELCIICKYSGGFHARDCELSNALIAIDKAIGGGQ